MNPFKGRHFQRDIILWAVRWYCKYGISYRELQEMLAERGVNVDHSTIYRWVQRYAPEMEKRLRWYWRNPSDLCPWHMDETYVKVNGRWAYLYRAVDSRGRTVDFYLSSRRNSKAAYRFLGKILNNVKKWQIPRFINTDKAPAYGRALALLKREGRCPSDVEHRQIKYRNNVIECDHGKLKRIIGATLGFKSMKTAYATIKGIEVMRALRKGQASAFYYGDPLGEMRLFHQHDPAIFGVALERDVYVEAICDGRHLHPGTVRLYLKAKGYDRVVAVTDSIMAAGLPDGSYKLGVNDVIVEDGDAKLPNGVRAGSTLTMAQALRNLMAFTGEGAETVSRLMTANPARLMGWAGKGELDVGKDADLVLLDGDYQVARTVVGGRTVYTR